MAPANGEAAGSFPLYPGGQSRIFLAEGTRRHAGGPRQPPGRASPWEAPGRAFPGNGRCTAGVEATNSANSALAGGNEKPRRGATLCLVEAGRSAENDLDRLGAIRPTRGRQKAGLGQLGADLA